MEEAEAPVTRAGHAEDHHDWSVISLRGVTTKDVLDFLAAWDDLTSVAPMSAAFADVVETRIKALRMKGLGEEALVDALRWAQRNSLFFALFRWLTPPQSKGIPTIIPIDADSSNTWAEGEPEPLWYVVDSMVHRHLQLKRSEAITERQERPGASTDDAEALWQEFWANYRKKASEPKASNAQLRAGPGALPKATAPQASSPIPTAPTTPRWRKTIGAPESRAALICRTGPRTAGLAALAGPPASAPGGSRPSQRAAVSAVAERILQEHRLFEEQLSSMAALHQNDTSCDSPSSDEAPAAAPKAPRSQVARDNHKVGSARARLTLSPAPTVELEGPGPGTREASAHSPRSMTITGSVSRAFDAAENPQSARRNAQFKVELPRLRSKEDDDGIRRRHFKSFDDYKQRKELICEIPAPKKKHTIYRPGLAMNHLPPKPGEPVLSQSAYTLAKAAEKERLYAKEVFKEMSGRSQHEWTTALHEYMMVRKGREKPDLETSRGPRPMTPRKDDGRHSPAQAEFHRPWSREGMARDSCAQALPDEYMTPIQRYAKVCLSSGLHPQPKSVRFLVNLPPKLDIRGAGYSDEDLLGLAAALPFQGGLEAVDIGENSRLNDSSACVLLSVLAKRHQRNMRILSLDHCARLGKETVTLCTKLLQGPFCELQTLNLSGVSIAMHEYGELASALEVHPHVRSVHLAKTGLGFFNKQAAAQVIRSIVANRRITELELGWNSLSLSAFEVLGRGLAENQHVVYLGLASTGPCPDPDTGGSPLLVLLELLHGDKTLTSLDISNNVLSGSAAFLLEYSFQRHPRLSFLDISRNPLGPDGMRSLIRLLAHPECSELTQIVANECAGGRSIGECNCFFDTDPSGSYMLNMAEPTQRALLQLLLARLTERLPAAPLGTFFSNATLSVPGKEVASFSFDTLKRGKGGWQVPQAGDLNFELSAGSVLLSSEDNNASPADVVARIIRRTRMTLTGQRDAKVLAVLTFIKSASEELNRAILLDALSRDFLLTSEHIKALCHTESKYVNSGHDPAGSCCLLMSSVFDAVQMREAVANTVSCSDALRVNRAGHCLLSLNLENPTGHYDLALSEPMDRTSAERLLLLNRWQFHVWKASGLIDISQHENGKNVRNEVYSGRSFVWAAEEWHLPCGGGSLSFDYVPLCRAPKGAEPIAADTWKEILARLKVAMREDGSGISRQRSCCQADSPSARRQRSQRFGRSLGRSSTRNLEVKDLPNMISAEEVLWVLRAASGRFWIVCRQLRELICLFHDTKLRLDALAYFFLRCLDWPVNGKLCRAKFSADEWQELRKRLGYINLFPYFQPECLPASLDLADHEQRRVMHCLVRLQSSESVRNIKKPRIDKNGTNNFETFTAGIPMSWDQYDSIPCKGIVELTYMCSMEHVRLRARRRLAALVGGWTALPEENNKLQSMLLWWSVLDDVPLEVVRVLVFLVTYFKDLKDAFNACDANKDGMLNHKEFVKKLLALGCCSSRRGPRGESPGPYTDAGTAGTKDDQEEVLTAVYRFLDTSNDGDISKREFEILNAIWRELWQSMWEFKAKMLDAFGSLQEAWEAAKQREGTMTYASFVRFAGECQYDGPLRQIFMYLDQDNNETIHESEWMRLAEAIDKDPELNL